MHNNLKTFLNKNPKKIQGKKYKPVILNLLKSSNMDKCLRIIDKKVAYLLNNTGGKGKLKEWFLSDDRNFQTITAERYIIDYLREKNSNVLDNLGKKRSDALLDCGHEKIGIEITTLNSSVAEWIFVERLSEVLDTKGLFFHLHCSFIRHRPKAKRPKELPCPTRRP